MSGTISDNHGHVATLTGTQLDAGFAVILNIQGTATHSRLLSLTASQVQQIAAGTKVAQESSTNLGHSHLVTF